jgi:hypothetical protein
MGRIVDQNIHATEPLDCLLDDGTTVDRVLDVAARQQTFASRFFDQPLRRPDPV